MSLTIELPPDVELRLTQEAARRGVEVGEYVRQLIEQQLPQTPLWDTLSRDEWIKAFRAWVDSHDPHLPPLPPEAMTRESFYEDSH